MTRRHLLPSLFALAAMAVGCKSPQPDPRFRPTESVLEVVAVLRRHVPDDTYRFEPAVDFTGRNIYRASLVHLENFEKIHSESLRSGYMDDVIAFAKGRSLERLRAFDLASESYRVVAQREGPLRLEALRSASVCDTLGESARIGLDPDLPPDLEDGDLETELAESAAEALEAYDRRVALLEAVQAEVGDSHYAFVIQEELERADIVRARYFLSVRSLSADGDVRALGEAQRVAARHRESKYANRHLMNLADLYAEIAEEYVEAHPPEGLLFDPPEFQELAEAATRLYEVVANQDGTPEKLEATYRLEAFLAFTLQVDRDRFTP